MKAMPPKSLSFEGYKAFKQRQTIELGSLTLLFGYNNSGKSAAIRALPLLASSFKNGDRKQTYTNSWLDYSAQCIRGATFKDLSHANQPRMSFGLSWPDGCSIDFDLRQDGIEGEEITGLNIASKSLTEESIGKYEFQRHIAGLPSLINVFEDKKNRDFLVTLDGFNFGFKNSGDRDKLEILLNHLNDFSQGVYWLNSIRKHPPRNFDIGNGIEIGIESDGGNTAQTLWWLGENKKPSFDDVNEWLINACGRKIDISSAASSASADGRRKVRLETIANDREVTSLPIRIPILDSGEGIAQALPVITLCAQAARGELGKSPIIVIEQPELHLHPRATVDLANFIVESIAKNPDVRYVIETHSESFLLAIQGALVDKQLMPTQTSCYWVSVDPVDSSSNLKKVDIDSDGFISGAWPNGVFNETLDQARELIKKRVSRKGKE